MSINLNKVDWTKIPAPLDDGGANHLEGARLPSVELLATNGNSVDLAALEGRTVIYTYPMTARPDVPLPDGWDMLPAKKRQSSGCTYLSNCCQIQT